MPINVIRFEIPKYPTDNLSDELSIIWVCSIMRNESHYLDSVPDYNFWKASLYEAAIYFYSYL